MHANTTLDDGDAPATNPIALALAPIARLLLTPKEAAAALRISPRLLWSLTRDGTIPAIRLRRAVRYAPSALQKFIDNAK
jgi:excisionase family DNA binding protein